MSDALDTATAALAQIVLANETLESVLDTIVHLAKDVIRPADAVSCTLIRGDESWTPAYTDTIGLEADELQYAAEYGPCMDAGKTGHVLVIDDMRTDERWPTYTPRVLRTGILSSASFPMPVQTEVLGAINVYSLRPHVFQREHLEVGAELASYAAVAVANARALHSASSAAQQMREAMASRAEIEQAKGVIMAERRCSPEEAFTVLVRASQHSNRKLRDVARDVVKRFVPASP
ncbi:MAG: GAF and ANTAR domain-containing protein [Actinomycetales bacterium]